MLIDFFYTLRDAKVPVTIREFLSLLEALDKGVIATSLDDFYYLARLTLVKDEAHFDKFDRAFGLYFKGIDTVFEKNPSIPLDWLVKRMERELTPEQKAALEKFGYDKLMDRLNELLKEQKEKHEGGSKWIGTGGTSPFGHGGANPEGIRIGGAGRNRTAVKVWEQRSYKDYDADRELGTRNLKVALRRLRKFARQGADDELALGRHHPGDRQQCRLSRYPHAARTQEPDQGADADGCGRNDGRPYRTHRGVVFSGENRIQEHGVFLLSQLRVRLPLEKQPQTARRALSHLGYFAEVPGRYALIFVGDATMSPYEVLAPGGSVEYNNEEAGAEWLARFCHAFPKFAWLNPEPEGVWQYRQSVSVIKQIMGDRMFPVTLEGLERAMRVLSK